MAVRNVKRKHIRASALFVAGNRLLLRRRTVSPGAPCDRTVRSQAAWPVRQPAGLTRPSARWKPGGFQLHSARARLPLIPDVAHQLDTIRRKRKTGDSTEHERPARSPYRMMALPPPWGRFQ